VVHIAGLSGFCLVIGCYKFGKALSRSIKGGEFLD
jgi:hypothetical protein